jgi:hypothetical protein
LAAAAMSASEIVGSAHWTSAYSYSMPGITSSVKKWRRYSAAKDPLSLLSRSL